MEGKKLFVMLCRSMNCKLTEELKSILYGISIATDVTFINTLKTKKQVKLLEGCKRAAKSQFSLFNCHEYIYSHKNQLRSLNSIRFKATRQWVRVDSIQHVECFFSRLYKAEN